VSGGFSNPIIGGGGALVYPSIHSPNFNLPAKTGWSIDKDGNAFFFTITAAGKIVSTGISGETITIDNGEILFHAPGNFADGIIIDLGTGSMSFQSSQSAAGDTPASLGLLSKLESESGTAPVITTTCDLQIAAGNNVWATDPNNPNGIENWHVPAFGGAGWTNSGSGPHLKYRLVSSPPNSVEIIGDMIASGSAADNAVVTTLPVGYRPQTNQIIPLLEPGITTTPGAGMPRLFLATNGQIQCDGIGGLAGSRFVITAGTFIALDA
jgi:hypothetical protein